MKTTTARAELTRSKSSSPLFPVLTGLPRVLGAQSQELLTQKERALFRLAVAIGAQLEPEVRSYARRALEAGWTAEEVRYAAGLAMNGFGTSPLLTASLWVDEVLAKNKCSVPS